MATPRGEARNAVVLRAAAELMVEKGYAGASIGDIAQAVGMTKAGLYHHISSKQEMLFQILVHAMGVLEREVIEPAAALPDAESRLREWIRLHVQVIFRHGPELTLLFPERRHLEPNQREFISEQIEGYLALFQRAMRELDQQGKLQNLDIDIASRHILWTIVGIARWHPRRGGASEERLIEQTVNFNLSAVLKQA